MLEDYASFANALLDLYEVTGEYYYLARAIALTDWQIVLFEDVEGGGLLCVIDGSRIEAYPGER